MCVESLLWLNTKAVLAYLHKKRGMNFWCHPCMSAIRVIVYFKWNRVGCDWLYHSFVTLPKLRPEGENQQIS